MVPSPTIVFERNGFPVELVGERDWRRAIERGHLARDTPVTIFRRPGAGQMMSAAQVPELLAIFDALEPFPPAPGPAAQPAPEEPPAPPTPLAEDAFAPHPPSWDDARTPGPEWDPDDFHDQMPSPPSPEPTEIPGPVKAIGWCLGVVLILALIGRCGSGSTPANMVDPAMNTAPTDSVSERKAEPAAPASFEPSFDCQAAALPAERTICATRELAAQDREMARLYSAATEQSLGETRAALVEDQRRWLEQRNACGSAPSPVACLSRLYVDRIGALHRPSAAENPENDVTEAAQPLRRAPAPRRAATPAPLPETVLCILPDGIEAQISLEQCRARSGVRMSD